MYSLKIKVAAITIMMTMMLLFPEEDADLIQVDSSHSRAVSAAHQAEALVAAEAEASVDLEEEEALEVVAPLEVGKTRSKT